MHPQCYRPGFTLIEMMLAVALGSLLVYTAMAAFRVASQTVTITNRICLENSLIRAGIHEAHNQLDFWTNLDDPDNAGDQRLRAANIDVGGTNLGARLSEAGLPAKAGLIFAKMSDVFPPNKLSRPATTTAPSSQVPRFTTALSPQVLTTAQLNGKADWESDAGFDPTCVWAPHDPRTWYRGNCIEKDGGAGRPLWFGRYAIFTNTDANPLLKDFDDITPAATYSATPLHLWYGRQLLGFSRAFGFYGMCDYMPSNVLYSTYTSFVNGGTNRGGIPTYFLPNRGTHESFVGQGMINVPTLGIYALTVTQSYGVSNPVRRTIDDKTLATEYYRFYDSDYSAAGGGGKTELQQFINITIPMSPLMKQQPQHWSVVSVGVGHFVKSAKFVSIAKIRWESPLTGSLTELSFTGVGSSLRGARMQRKPGSGWAKWDNVSASANDANLDTP